MGERQRVRLDSSRKLPRIRTAPFQGGRATLGYADEEAHVRVKTLGRRCYVRRGVGNIAKLRLVGRRAAGCKRAGFLGDELGIRAHHGERGFQVMRERRHLVALAPFGIPACLEGLLEREAHSIHRGEHFIDLAHAARFHGKVQILL